MKVVDSEGLRTRREVIRDVLLSVAVVVVVAPVVLVLAVGSSLWAAVQYHRE